MALEPEDQGQEQNASDSSLSHPEAGQTEAPLDLQNQITEMKRELLSLKTENSGLRDQLSAVTASQGEEDAPLPYEGSWKPYEKDEFIVDFDEALQQLKNSDEEGQSQQVAPTLAEATAINEESPSDIVQDEPESNEEESADGVAEPEEPVVAEVSEEKTDPDDDEIQELLTAAEESSTEVVPDEEHSDPEPEASSKVDTSAVSDDDIQAMFAAAAGGSEAQSEADAAEEPELAANEDDHAEIAEEQPVEAKAEKPSDDSREAMSEDEIASLIAAEAERTASDSAKPEGSSGGEEEEMVEVGFTALQAGKDVDDEVSEDPSASAQEEENEEVEAVEEPVVRRELVTVSFEIDEDAVEKVPSHLAIAALAVPVRVTEAGLVCKVASPIDRASIDLIEVAVAMQVVAEPAPMEEVLDALRSTYGSEFLWNEREAVMGVAPSRYKSNRSKKGFLRRAA